MAENRETEESLATEETKSVGGRTILGPVGLTMTGCIVASMVADLPGKCPTVVDVQHILIRVDETRR